MKSTQIILAAALIAVGSYVIFQKNPTNTLTKSVVPEETKTIQTTCALIKPDAVKAGTVKEILQIITDAGLTIKQMQEKQFSKEDAENFYAIHKERPFFNDLVEFMSSGPIVALELEGENAVIKWRELMGATNPANATAGTIRQLFGRSVTQNAVHGSDSIDNASLECSQVFKTAS
jgi:nucleoside-diphosphate kinase